MVKQSARQKEQVNYKHCPTVNQGQPVHQTDRKCELWTMNMVTVHRRTNHCMWTINMVKQSTRQIEHVTYEQGQLVWCLNPPLLQILNIPPGYLHLSSNTRHTARIPTSPPDTQHTARIPTSTPDTKHIATSPPDNTPPECWNTETGDLYTIVYTVQMK